jgi:hypothetical protein
MELMVRELQGFLGVLEDGDAAEVESPVKGLGGEVLGSSVG